MAITPRRPASRTRAVPRRRVAAATVLTVVVVFAFGALIEELRHPLPETSTDPDEEQVDEPVADPRATVECGEPPPREGQERDTDVLAPPRDPIVVNSNQLYDCPQTYSGATVSYEGEVVGAVLRRNDGVWLHLNDDIYAGVAGPLPAHRDYRGGNGGVGVFVPASLTDDIDFVGGPEARGDVVHVVGPFRRVDPVSGEVAVIVANEARVVDSGEPFLDPVLTDRQVTAGIIIAVTLGLFVTSRLVARRERESGVRSR